MGGLEWRFAVDIDKNEGMLTQERVGSEYKTIDKLGLVIRDVMANGLMGIMELEHGTPKKLVSVRLSFAAR
jgi:hypothetical protein